MRDNDKTKHELIRLAQMSMITVEMCVTVHDYNFLQGVPMGVENHVSPQVLLEPPEPPDL